MANNAISRTGTHTTYPSGSSSGVSGIWEYNKWKGTGSAGSSGITGTYHYSNDDLKNGSIFTDIDSKISITFSQEVDNSSVKTFNKDIEIPLALQNQKGTIGLTHAVTGSESTASIHDDNNLQALKLTSVPEVVFSTTSIQEFVEMSSIAETSDNITYELTPKANLSSNTTYFLKIDTTNLTDASGAGISYSTERGFVTDNTKSFVVTNDYYEGFSMQIENAPLLGEGSTAEVSPDTTNASHPKFDKGDTMSLYRADGATSGATALKIQSIDGTKLTYQLEPDSYSMNVSYTATDPIMITNINHNLIDDDKIEVYDIVSGNVVAIGEYTITEITSDTFSIPVDGTGSDAGALNYYRNVNKDDLLVWSESKSASETTYTIRKKVLSVPMKKDNSSWRNLLNNTFSTIKDSTSVSSGAKGKIIKASGSTISYVPVDTNGTLTTDTFVNNSIIDISTSTNDVRLHIKANTSPEHNVHPFHSSAPKVNSIFPKDGGSFPRKLTITQITRKGAIALVSTNHPHNLLAGGLIKIVDSTQAVYNKTIPVLYVPTSNTFQYDMGSSSGFSGVQSPAPGKPKLQIGTGDPVTYAERYNAIFVNFSQSMNTSTITVANSTHLISANGSTGDFVAEESFAYAQDSASSTIQLSDSGFEDIESCVSVIASSGNSVFAIVPEILRREHRYKVKVKTGIQDLGKTNSIYEFTTTEGVATGVVVRDPQTGEEIIYSKDEDPPKIKKISFSSSGTDGVAGMVLESDTLSEITSPDVYQAVATDLNDESLLIQFSESMDIGSVTSATSNTDPTGTVQMSSDNYNTVVQMSADPVVSTTDEDNDTFKFTPIANLSANTTYTLKVAKDVRDASAEENQMLTDNVSSIKVLTVNAAPSSSENYYVPGEIISGIRTLTIKANTGTLIPGLTAGAEFLGLTSKGKGKVLDFTLDSGDIANIRYTELAGADGSIKPLSPGEVCKVSDTVNFTIDNVAITDPPAGNVVSFVSSTRKIIYRDNRVDNEFVSANSSAERIVGRTSDGYAFASSSGTEGIAGSGFKTDTTAVIANVFFANSDGDLVSPVGGNQEYIDENSNLTVTFNQTMNVESINFNVVDSIVRDPYNILLSYDPLFGNTIPLSTDFTSSNNDTVFEFQPAILSNTSLQLTQDMNLYARVTQTAKNKGGMNLASQFSPSNDAELNRWQLYSPNTFTSTTASVFTPDGQEVELGLGTSVSMPNQTSTISKTTSIIIHFNEVPQFPPVRSLYNQMELSTASNFASGVVIVGSNPSQRITGIYGTQVHLQLDVVLTASTQYYLRFLAWPSHTYMVKNEGGVGIYPPAIYFNSFTTTA